MKQNYTLLEDKELLPGTTDALFKVILPHQDFRGLLSLILSECINMSPHYIKEHLVFLNTELPKEQLKEKGKITDILASIEGTILNIECNQNNNPSTAIKNNFYHHAIFARSIRLGEKIEKRNVYQINFNTKTRFDNRMIIEFILRDDSGKYIDEENFKRLYINLAKPLEKYYNKEELTKIEKILVMLQLRSRKELIELAKGDEELMGLEKIIEALNEDEGILGLYDEEKMKEGMHEIDIAYAKYEEKIEIAKKMLKSGMDRASIIEITGLTEEEIIDISKAE